MSETWKQVVGYEGLYEVSDHGNIRSVARVAHSSYRGKPVLRQLREFIKKTSVDAYGYKMVQLVKDGTEHSLTIHKLVARAFLGIKPTGYDVHHKDENKHNNNLDNLEYKDHRVHLSEHNKGKYLGSKNAQSVLDEDEVSVINQLLKSNAFSSEQIARAFGVSTTTISHIKTRKVWTHVDNPQEG